MQYNYLKDFLRNTKGVSQGYLIYDRFGYPVNRVGRHSNNPKWYRDFYQKHKRKPNKKDLDILTREHLQYGFYDEYGFIPPIFPVTINRNSAY